MTTSRPVHGGLRRQKDHAGTWRRVRDRRTAIADVDHDVDVRQALHQVPRSVGGSAADVLSVRRGSQRSGGVAQDALPPLRPFVPDDRLAQAGYEPKHSDKDQDEHQRRRPRCHRDVEAFDRPQLVELQDRGCDECCSGEQQQPLPGERTCLFARRRREVTHRRMQRCSAPEQVGRHPPGVE